MAKSKINELLFLGSEGLDPSIARRIVLSNKLALLLFVVATPYFFFFQWVSFRFAAVVLPLLFCFGSVLFLNWKRRYVFARLVLLLAACGGAFFYADSLGREAGVQLLYFAFLGMPFILFCE